MVIQARFMTIDLQQTSETIACVVNSIWVSAESTVNMTAPNGQDAGSSSSASQSNIVEVPEPHYSFDPQPTFDYHSLDGKDPTICIDNG